MSSANFRFEPRRRERRISFPEWPGAESIDSSGEILVADAKRLLAALFPRNSNRSPKWLQEGCWMGAEERSANKNASVSGGVDVVVRQRVQNSCLRGNCLPE